MSLVDVLRNWGPLLFTALGNGVLAWLSVRFAGKGEVAEAHQAALNAHHRIDLLEKDVKGLPDYDVTNRIEKDLGQVQQNTASTNAEVRMLREQFSRMDEFLREHVVTKR